MSASSDLAIGRVSRHIRFRDPGRDDRRGVCEASFEDFLVLDVEGRTEWVNGEVHLLHPVTDSHQRVLQLIATLMELFCDVRDTGRTFGHGYVFQASASRPARAPDLMWLTREHLDRARSSYLAGVPDFVLEVVCSTSVERDYVEKFREYEAAGIPEYWIIDSRPGHERADFFVLHEGRYLTVQPEDGIYRSTAVEGFWLRVEWLWDPEPRVSRVIDELLVRSLS